MRASWEYIATVYDNIASSHVRRSITCKVQIKPLDLLHMALPPQCRHTIGFVDGEGTGTHFGVKKPWGDNVDSGKFSPFSGKRFPKVRNEGLAGVVDWLVNGDIDNVATHARGNDQITKALLVEYFAGVFCTGEDAVDYRKHLVYAG